MATQSTTSRSEMLQQKMPHAVEQDGRVDFDFFIGSWNVSHRRLQKRLEGDTNWDVFGGDMRDAPDAWAASAMSTIM